MARIIFLTVFFLSAGAALIPAWEPPPSQKQIPNEFYIPGILQGPGDNNNLDKGLFLFSCLQQLGRVYGLGDTVQEFLRTNVVGRVRDLGPFCQLSQTHIYRLENCQALSAAALISYGLPLLLEYWKANTSSIQWYALLYKFVRQKDPSPPMGKETGLVYLSHSYKNGLNLAKYREREVINGARVEVFPDYLNLKEPEKLSFNNNYFEIASNDYRDSKYNPNWITYADVYILLPASLSVKQAEALLIAALGGRDFSYKLPKFKQIF